ncbi:MULTISPECIES: DMT family transporter [Aeribacillus]|uniref:Multidrug efflux SMR transporter n=1 Tax=Aeribacillus composti TaxID=1868734 RepID=A0ABY9WDH3_9BACI|nr:MULTISPECIES: multidrug efflux SMR transporter [Aeribacillus]RZI51888.1 multidrug efflux SMR transporter [Aeribacillus pallidus]WNF34018.1 multidrug efflux SMR transporter [Aeribacillus composti]
MSWIFLIIAGCCEVIGVTGLTKVNSSPSFSSFFMLIGGFILSLYFLSLSMNEIPMSIAYAVWTGIGTVGSTLVGMYVFDEPKDKWRITFIALIIVSVIGLKLVD